MMIANHIAILIKNAFMAAAEKLAAMIMIARQNAMRPTSASPELVEKLALRIKIARLLLPKESVTEVINVRLWAQVQIAVKTAIASGLKVAMKTKPALWEEAEMSVLLILIVIKSLVAMKATSVWLAGLLELA